MKNENRPFVTQIDPSLAPKIQEDLRQQGFELNVAPYSIFTAKKKGVSFTLYESGKAVVQGKDKGEFIEFYLEPQVLGTFEYSHPEADLDLTPRGGSDEAGKGDYFGPLTVCSLWAEEAEIQKLFELGIADSKTINDKKIVTLAPQIRKLCAHSIVRIFPQKYNELYRSFGNLNQLLAWAHASAIEELVGKSSCTRVLVDKFASEHLVERALARKNVKIDLTQRTKAEEDLVVAAASVLARDSFLDGMKRLEEQCGMPLPKGAGSPVLEAGKNLVREQGFEVLPSVAKLHFKTTEQLREH